MKKFHIFLLMMLACNAYAATETINWYVDGSVYDTTTCQSGGNVNLPTQPTKRGHTFAGWVVALYDMSTLDYTTDGTNYTYNASAYTWATIFDYGLVSGTALCSVTPGSWQRLAPRTNRPVVVNIAGARQRGIPHLAVMLFMNQHQTWRGCSTARTVRLPIARPTVRSTAVTTSVTTPISVRACSGRNS